MYDLIVIGAGIGGYTAAIRAAKEKMKVALIEKNIVGGTCLNLGCIPVKYMIHVARKYRECQEAIEAGEYRGDIRLDFPQKLAEMNVKVERLSKGIQTLISVGKIDYYHGIASIEKDKSVWIDQKVRLCANKIIIATGAEPMLIDVPGIEIERVYTTDTIFQNMKGVPNSLLIVATIPLLFK